MKIHPNTPNNIGVEFKVWAPKLTRVTKKLFLLGSLKELGAWNIDKALRAYPTTDMHVWTVEVSIPAMCHFEWVWLTTNLSRKQVEWEMSNKRNMTVDCYSGTLHTVWGEPEEVFLQSATSLEVSTFVRVEDGYTLVLTGSTPSTGEWNLHYAKPATEFPKRSGYWKVNVAFDALTNLEFKWAVVKEKDQGMLRTQEKLSHSIFGRKSWIRAVAPWMTPMVVVVDTSLLCDLTDTKQGRTDVIVMERKQRAQEIKAWLLKAEEDKAKYSNNKTAQGPEPNPVEKPVSLTTYSQREQLTRNPSVADPSPTFSNLSLATAHRTFSLEETIKNKEEMTKSEKLIQQLYKKYNEETTTIHAIKGKGQKQLPTDKMNIGGTPVEGTEELFMAYGEVAEITSKHLSAFSNTVREKNNYHLFDTLGSPGKEKLARQSCERLVTDLVKSEDTPVTQEMKNLPMKEVVFSDNTSNEDEISNVDDGLDGMHLYVKSPTISETVPSDTGFTEMSSGRMDVTGSGSVLTSSHTLTCVLAGEADDVSDSEESRSDYLALQRHRLDNEREANFSFWESNQTDLTPPWLDKSCFNIQDGDGELLSDNISANEEDDEDFDWLASNLEDHYPMANLDADFELSHDSSLANDKPFNSTDAEVKQGFSFQIEQELLLSPNPSNSSPKNCSSFTFSEDDQNLSGDGTGVCFSQDFDPLYENDLTPYAGISTAFKHEESVERRRIARHLEDQWGSRCQSLGSQPTKNVVKLQPPPLSNGDNQSSVISNIADGIRDLMSADGKVYKMAYYSYSELSGLLLPDVDTTNHREKAREIERMWGDSQVNKSRLGSETEMTSTIFNGEELVCESLIV